MCHDLDSSPPIPVLAGAAVSHEDVVLDAQPTATASPRSPRHRTSRPSVGIVILPDVRGLYRFYEELALRFAERGYPAVAIDYFGRTAGVAKRDDEFPFMDHVAQTTPEGVQRDVAAAAAYLRSPEGGSRTHIFTVGFCFGGRNSWLSSAGGHDLAGRDRLLRHARRAQRPARADRPRRRDAAPRSWPSRPAPTPTSPPPTTRPSTRR